MLNPKKRSYPCFFVSFSEDEVWTRWGLWSMMKLMTQIMTWFTYVPCSTCEQCGKHQVVLHLWLNG
ncbi:hypothetical protein HanPSC8_Chr16g0698731 [Helianthus annuus]|nr:hypothetical protein HanPSC8_Chr16g0698731 [Helianthus annuus]